MPEECKFDIPILSPDQYNRLAQEPDIRFTYSVLWWGTYNDGWAVHQGGHPAVDIATAQGTPVYAIQDGVVVRAGFLQGYGLSVTIEHTDGSQRIYSAYSHLHSFSVNVGDRVSRWQRIGEVGNTGTSIGAFGNHLDFQIIVSPTLQGPYGYHDCPGSYTSLVNNGSCRDHLQLHTVDPLLFFHNKWVTSYTTFEEMQRIRATTTFPQPSNTTTAVTNRQHATTQLASATASVTTTSSASSATSSTSVATPSSTNSLANRVLSEPRSVTLPNGRVLPPFQLYHSPSSARNTVATRTMTTDAVVQTDPQQRTETLSPSIFATTLTQQSREPETRVAKPQTQTQTQTQPTVPVTQPRPAAEPQPDSEPAPEPRPSHSAAPAPTPTPAPTPAPAPSSADDGTPQRVATYDGAYEIIVLPQQHFVDHGRSTSMSILIRRPDGSLVSGILPTPLSFVSHNDGVTFFPSSLSFLQNGKRTVRIDGQQLGRTTIDVMYDLQRVASFDLNVVR